MITQGSTGETKLILDKSKGLIKVAELSRLLTVQIVPCFFNQQQKQQSKSFMLPSPVCLIKTLVWLFYFSTYGQRYLALTQRF